MWKGEGGRKVSGAPSSGEEKGERDNSQVGPGQKYPYGENGDYIAN